MKIMKILFDKAGLKINEKKSSTFNTFGINKSKPSNSDQIVIEKERRFGLNNEKTKWLGLEIDKEMIKDKFKERINQKIGYLNVSIPNTKNLRVYK